MIPGGSEENAPVRSGRQRAMSMLSGATFVRPEAYSQKERVAKPKTGQLQRSRSSVAMVPLRQQDRGSTSFAAAASGTPLDLASPAQHRKSTKPCGDASHSVARALRVDLGRDCTDGGSDLLSSLALEQPPSAPSSHLLESCRELSAIQRRELLVQLHDEHGPRARELTVHNMEKWVICQDSRKMHKNSQAPEKPAELLANLAKLLPGLSAAALPKLTALRQTGMMIGHEGIRTVASAIEAGVFPQLKCLNLAGCNICDAAATTLSQPLGSDALPGLERLHLGSNRIANQGAAAIALALPRLRTLRSLDLGANQIGDEGFLALVKALRSEGGADAPNGRCEFGAPKLEYLFTHPNQGTVVSQQAIRALKRARDIR